MMLPVANQRNSPKTNAPSATSPGRDAGARASSYRRERKVRRRAQRGPTPRPASVDCPRRTREKPNGSDNAVDQPEPKQPRPRDRAAQVPPVRQQRGSGGQKTSSMPCSDGGPCPRGQCSNIGRAIAPPLRPGMMFTTCNNSLDREALAWLPLRPHHGHPRRQPGPATKTGRVPRAHRGRPALRQGGLRSVPEGLDRRGGAPAGRGRHRHRQRRRVQQRPQLGLLRPRPAERPHHPACDARGDEGPAVVGRRRPGPGGVSRNSTPSTTAHRG